MAKRDYMYDGDLCYSEVQVWSSQSLALENYCQTGETLNKPLLEQTEAFPPMNKVDKERKQVRCRH